MAVGSEVFRPSAQVRLQIRIDEGADADAVNRNLQVGEAPAGTPAPIGVTQYSKDAALSSNRAARRSAARARDMYTDEEFASLNRYLDEQRTKIQLEGPEQKRPYALEVQGDDDLVVFGGILPISCSIERNGVMEADTAEIEIDFRDAPIDPRIVRAAFVEIVIGTVNGQEFADGVHGVRRGDGSLLSVVERASGQDVRFGSTTRFIGFVDEWDLKSGESGDSIKLRCRDLTAALASKRLPTNDRIDLTLPLADGVQQLIDAYPSTARLQVVFGPPSRTEPDPNGPRGPVPGNGVALKARKGKRAKRARQGSQDLKLWDHINDTVVAAGFVPIIRGYTLYLTEARTFYQGVDGARQLVYGRNLSELCFARKLAGDAPVPTIEVRCPDPRLGKTRWARAPKPPEGRASGIIGESDPPKPSRANKLSPGSAAEEEIRTILITGTRDGEQLERIAQTLYEQIGRQEIEGNWTTSNVSSFGSREDGDLLDLQPGDPVEVLIAPLNAASSGDSTNTAPGGSVSSLQELQSMSIARRAAFLRQVGWSEQTAERLAIAQEQTRLVSTFRAATVNVDWSASDGLTIGGDFVNFLVVRENADGSIELGPSAAANAASLGRSSSAATAVRDRSAAANTLAAKAQAGELTPDAFAADASDARAAQARAVKLNRAVG